MSRRAPTLPSLPRLAVALAVFVIVVTWIGVCAAGCRAATAAAGVKTQTQSAVAAVTVTPLEACRNLLANRSAYARTHRVVCRTFTLGTVRAVDVECGVPFHVGVIEFACDQAELCHCYYPVGEWIEWTPCFAGPGNSAATAASLDVAAPDRAALGFYRTACAAADADGDGDVDLWDVAAAQIVGLY